MHSTSGIWRFAKVKNAKHFELHGLIEMGEL